MCVSIWIILRTSSWKSSLLMIKHLHLVQIYHLQILPEEGMKCCQMSMSHCVETY